MIAYALKGYDIKKKFFFDQSALWWSKGNMTTEKNHPKHKSASKNISIKVPRERESESVCEREWDRGEKELKRERRG